MRHLIAFVCFLVVGCANQEDKQNYRQAQIDIVDVQAQAQAKQNQAAALERAELYKQMAMVSASNPEVADAIAVGLALAAAQLNADQGRSAPITQLKTESNTAIELARALGPAALAVVGQVGVAAISADVQRTMSNNQADVQRNRDNVMGGIVTGVTGMAQVAIDGAGTDYYLQDNAFVDNSTDSSTNTTSTSTTTNTYSETNTDNSINDSYNYTEANTSESTSSAIDDNSVNTNNVITWTTGNGESLTTDQVLDILADGLTLTLVINGQETEVDAAAACELDPSLCP